MAFVLETISETISNEAAKAKTIEELEDEYCEARYLEDHELFPEAVPIHKFLGEYLLGTQVKGNIYRIRMADKGTAPEYVNGELKDLPLSLNGLLVRVFKGGCIFGAKGIVHAYALSANMWNTRTKGFDREHRAWLLGELAYGEYLDGSERSIPEVTIK